MATRSFARSLYWRIGFGFIFFLAITLALQVGALHLGRRRNRRRHARAHGPRFCRARRVGIRSRAGARSAARSARLCRASRQGTAPAGGDHFSRWQLRSRRAGTEVPRGMRFPGPFRRRGRRDGQAGGGPGRRSSRSAARGRRSADCGSRACRSVRRAAVRSWRRSNTTTRSWRWCGCRRSPDCAASPNRSARRSRIGVLLLLIGGTAIAALVIFRPAQARLRALEDAAQSFRRRRSHRTRAGDWRR